MNKSRARKLLPFLISVPAAFLLGWSLRPLVHDPALPRVTGIGGIFFKCQDPAKLKAWYADHFGMKMDEYGALFEYRSTDDPAQKAYLQWAAFGPQSTYFKAGNKDFMVNYRVTGMRTLMEKLRHSGATVLDSAAETYGTFVHVLDPDSTVIELWEPVDSVFTGSYEGKTTH